MAPPQFVRLVGHDLRWKLLAALGESDRAVRELTEIVDEPQNLVSYHLRQLRDGGLVTARRSTADARDNYYAIDLARCRSELQATGVALHPGFALVPPAIATPPVRRRALFLCTGNSSRSQIAEALLTKLSDASIEAVSAGSHPKQLHPNAVRVMRTRGIDISANQTKHLDRYTGERFDVVITLCDRVREVCPEFPRHPRRAHWSVPDPALAGATNRASYPAFERTAVELEGRIEFLLHQLNTLPTPRRPQHAER